MEWFLAWLASWFWPKSRAEEREPIEHSPFDHDRDGKPGGSLPADQRGVSELRSRYEFLTGRKADRRWGGKTLREKIALAEMEWGDDA
jgi:hypothetical protein